MYFCETLSIRMWIMYHFLSMTNNNMVNFRIAWTFTNTQVITFPMMWFTQYDANESLLFQKVIARILTLAPCSALCKIWHLIKW